MSRSFRVRHEWLRRGLEDAGRTQKDLAEAWGVTQGQVSRYINSGEPKMTLERAQAIKVMLGLSLDEIFMHDAELPIHELREAHNHVEQTATPETQALAPVAFSGMDELKRAVDKVRAELGPGYTVEIVIKATGY